MIDQYIRDYGKRLFGLCTFLCANSYEAEDLYQETWLKVVKNIEKYDSSKEFEPWLTTICVNTYRNTREGKLFNKANYLNFDILCDKTVKEGAIFIYSYEGTDAPPDYIRINHNGKEVELTPNISIGEPFLPVRTGYPEAMPY